jgi:hypothetical protein
MVHWHGAAIWTNSAWLNDPTPAKTDNILNKTAQKLEKFSNAVLFYYCVAFSSVTSWILFFMANYVQNNNAGQTLRVGQFFRPV